VIFLGDFWHFSFVKIFLTKLSCYHDNYFKYFMFGKYNGFVSKARVSACMYFLVYCRFEVDNLLWRFSHIHSWGWCVSSLCDRVINTNTATIQFKSTCFFFYLKISQFCYWKCEHYVIIRFSAANCGDWQLTLYIIYR
jgi:hypothetical protein